MAYSKNIIINEDGPKIYSNGNLLFNDISLTLKDYSPAVNKTSSTSIILNKGDEYIINGKWSFLYIRMRWLDKPVKSNNGGFSIYDACSSTSVVAKNCSCDNTVEKKSEGKTVAVPTLATIQMDHYTEYLLSSGFGYLNTDITFGATGTKVNDLYDNNFNAVIMDDVLYFKNGIGPTGATANPYPIDKEYYAYVNQDKDVLFVFDIGNDEWVLINTDTDLSIIDGTENILINNIEQVTWGVTSEELGNSSNFIPANIGPTNSDTFTISGSIDIKDENQPVTFKFSEIFVFNAFKFSAKIISDIDNQEINILTCY